VLLFYAQQLVQRNKEEDAFSNWDTLWFFSLRRSTWVLDAAKIGEF
jgi:hypothetical protein